MDALDLLTADHNRVRGLFGRFKDAESEDNTSEQAVLAGKIVEELEVHTTIEEEIFYPAVHDLSSSIGDIVDEGLEEHHVAKTLIGELKPLKAGSDQWVAKMKVLMESVEHHADEEEKEMFPKVRSATDASKRETLGEKMEVRKVELGGFAAADNDGNTVAELRQKASEQDIPGRSKMDREELAATVDPK
jgi:hemerythrin superfamily protein